jgi:3-oxoadipate enol-lactonase
MIALHTFYQSTINKKTLVLLHAFPLSSAMWERAARIIMDSAPEVSIICADFPGFGTAPVEQQWTLTEGMIDLDIKLIDQGITMPVIGGLSMGGYAVFAYYRLFPNKVKAIVLSNTKPDPDSQEAKMAREEYALDVEQRGVEAVYERQLDKLISGSSRLRNPSLIPTLKKWIESFSPEAIATCLRTLAVRDDSTDLLEKINCPTFVIAGEKDIIIPSQEMQSFSKKIPLSQYIQLSDVGHLSALENPEVWGKAVSEFLNGL